MATRAVSDPKADLERNKAIVEQFYESDDPEVRQTLLAPDFAGRAPGAPSFDRDGFLRNIAELTAAFPDGAYTNDRTIAEGDVVVTVGRFRGTQRGVFHGAPPTGKPVTFAAVHVDRVRDGKIVEHLRISVPEAVQPAEVHGPTKARA